VDPAGGVGFDVAQYVFEGVVLAQFHEEVDVVVGAVDLRGIPSAPWMAPAR
jgi:hypothetical protein